MKLIYITVPDKSTATNIAKTLITEKLAACVNIMGTIDSHYIWKGNIESSNEVAMFVKTTEALEDKILSRVKEIHPYEVPCVISIGIANGNPDFIKYVNSVSD